jgi:endonuclease/exonuclease/phosphatase family metal-dependent hydrolase
MGLYFANHSPIESTRSSISIATLNTQIGKKLFPKTDKARERLWVKFEDKIIAKDIDVYCFQECNKPPRRLLDKLLPSYHKHHPEESIAVIYSKYPIVNKGHIKIGHYANTCIWADIKLPSGTIRVYNPHLSSNKVSQTTTKLIDQPDLRDDRTWSDIKYVLNNYSVTAKQRVKEVGLIKEHMETSPYPIILAGDLNDTPLSYTYKVLTEELRDAYCIAGSGFGNTYAGSIPMLRIDYTLVDSNFDILNYELVREKFSDHYPIITTLNLSE